MKLIAKTEGTKLYDLENGYYISQEHCSWAPQGYRLMIRPMGDRYLPSIFTESEKDIPTFVIQTTSYGSLPPTEIKKVIAGFQIALDTIDMTKKLTALRVKVESGNMMNYSEWCSLNSYKGWLISCDSFRLYQKYIEPLLPYADDYYKCNIKPNTKKGRKVT